MFRVSSSGSFKSTEDFLKKAKDTAIFDQLSRYGQIGVNALANATPVASGVTAASWYYEIVRDSRYWGIIWKNAHVVDGRPIAILLQYGHGTRTGGYVQGRDYINPAIKPIFDRIEADGLKAVKSA